MKNRLPCATLLFALTTLAPFTALADSAQRPSYEQQKRQFLQQRSNSPDAAGFSAEDRRIMQQAADNLANRLTDPGLKVGTRAPDFTLNNAFGSPLTLSGQWQKGPVVLVFYRGAWCPFCNLHLRVLQQSVPAFSRYGAQLIAVTPQRPDKSAAQISKDGLPFEVLSDLDSTVMKAYGLYYELDPELVEVYVSHDLDVAEYNGEGRNVLPVPGTFVIDTQGVIRAVHADVDYKERMEPEAILEALEGLQPPEQAAESTGLR
jgi:peroxiredoxin